MEGEMSMSVPFAAPVDFHGDRHITRWRPLVRRRRPMTPVTHPENRYAHPPTGVSTPERIRPKPRATRRSGYIAAAAVNAVMLWVANSLLGWGWPPFLTAAFDHLLPWIDASLAAIIAVNLLWAWRDTVWFRHLGQIALNLISIMVVVRTWQIFPFDFTGYWTGWETLARIAVAVAFFGLIIDTVTRVVAVGRTVHIPDHE
jgi:hypothetical protein